MSKKRWVQHISGQGEKWELHNGLPQNFPNTKCSEWVVKSKDRLTTHYLPRSEYREVPGEKVWRDVTEQVGISRVPGNYTYGGEDVIGCNPGYRLRKVRCGKSDGVNNPDWAFIVEQEVDE